MGGSSRGVSSRGTEEGWEEQGCEELDGRSRMGAAEWEELGSVGAAGSGR